MSCVFGLRKRVFGHYGLGHCGVHVEVMGYIARELWACSGSVYSAESRKWLQAVVAFSCTGDFRLVSYCWIFRILAAAEEPAEG